MATETQSNNHALNISNHNNLEKIIESPSSNQQGLDSERIIDFTKPKKVYYLASCDDNINLLKKEQIQGLTDVLIALKKDHDSIKMETKKVTDETADLEKKILMIQEIDSKTIKKNIESKFQNENMKKAIEATKIRLKEEEYKKKTLSSILSKIKKDIALNEISLQKSYEKQNNLNLKLQRQKILENEIKAKGNQINSQINTQKEKNKIDLKEYNLQVQYYNTIIEQKLEFIKSAEERKERQVKIAQDAKKTSGDKDEKDKREKLQLLYIINKYLQKKMEDELAKNKEIEDTFSKIKLICGTNNLKDIIEKVVFKEKRYNYIIKQINEQEQEKKKLNKEIQTLQKQLLKFKNELVIDVSSEKDIKIIKSKDFENFQSNEQLLNEEIELNEKYKFNKELNNLVSLRYDQVINSLRKLCTEQSINYMRDVSLNVSRLYNKSGTTKEGDQSSNIIINSNYENTNMLSNEDNDKLSPKKEEKKDEPKEDKIEETIKKSKKDSKIDPLPFLPEILKYSEEEKEEENIKAQNANNQKEENIKSNNNNSNIILETNNGNNNNNNNFNSSDNLNSNILSNNIMNEGSNIINEENTDIHELDDEEEKKLVQSYKDYLSQAEKTIDALFLIKTKKDFLQMIRDKASEYDEANKTFKIIKKFSGKNKKRGSIARSVIISKDNLYREMEYCPDDNEKNKESELQDKIFRSYLLAERRKMEKFINNEKDVKPIKKS